LESDCAHFDHDQLGLRRISVRHRLFVRGALSVRCILHGHKPERHDGAGEFAGRTFDVCECGATWEVVNGVQVRRMEAPSVPDQQFAQFARQE
jgi:hypothetical protein